MTKVELHRLVDALPDVSLSAAAILLRRAQDPVAAKLDAAPYGVPELTGETCALSKMPGGNRASLGQTPRQS
jgi:hypothetical protein